MSRVKMAVARERKLRVLRMLCAMGADQAEVELSLSQMAVKAGLTYDQARGIMRSLVKGGQAQAFRRSLPNGGTGSNAYRVTPSGSELVQDFIAIDREAGQPWRG